MVIEMRMGKTVLRLMTGKGKSIQMERINFCTETSRFDIGFEIMLMKHLDPS